MVRVRWLGLVNIIAGRTVVPELLQEDASPERLTQEAQRLLTDQQGYQRMVADLRAVRACLGDPGASRRAAAVVLKECEA